MARGSADFINNLAKKSTGYKLAVLVIILVALGFLYWQFLYSSLKDEQQQLQGRRADLAKKVEALKEREARYREMVKSKEDLDKQLAANAEILPSSSELPAFFAQLQKQAGVAGVTLKTWKRLKEVPVETFIKVPVAVEVAGTFHQINNYFKLLYGTEDNDRIVTVESLSLGDATVRNDEVILTARFNATTYRDKDLPPDTSLDDPEPAPSGGKVGAATRAREAQVEAGAGEEDRSGGTGGAPARGGPSSAPKAGVDRVTNPGADVE